jgi:hypothetical protein
MKLITAETMDTVNYDFRPELQDIEFQAPVYTLPGYSESALGSMGPGAYQEKQEVV